MDNDFGNTRSAPTRAAFNAGAVDASVYSPLPADKVPPKHVLIAGLGRSGTTALAQLFSALGFRFEGGNAILENETYRTWFQERRLDLLAGIFSGHEADRRLGWKEPKLRSATGIELVGQFPPDVGVVVIFRDILATSLRNNQAMNWGLMDALEKSVSETRKLVTLVESVKNRPLLLISYEKLLLETELVVSMIAGWAGVADKELVSRAIKVIQPSPESYLQQCLDSAVQNNLKTENEQP